MSNTLFVPISGTERRPRTQSPLKNRVPSRSPQPYRRRQQPTSPSPPNSEPSTSPRLSCQGGSESGTEADDELTRRLPAPPRGRRTSSEDDEWRNRIGYGRGRWRRRDEAFEKSVRKKPNLGVAVLRRGIEVGLAAVLVILVIMGKEQRALKSILLQRKEVGFWLLSYLTVILAYPLRVVLRGSSSLKLPSSLDPSPLLYPILFPVLVALSLTPLGTNKVNAYLIPNLVISIANLPPILTFCPEVHWLLSLCPFIWNSLPTASNETLIYIAPICITLTSALTNILYPSLTMSELRLISAALINILLNASSPQAVIMRALTWGGGMGVYLLCEDIVKWNISLARVPRHRFRRAGHKLAGLSRLSKLAGLERISKKRVASDSEAEIMVPKKPSTTVKRRPFFASLTIKEAATLRLVYALSVYVILAAIVLFGLRPFIAEFVLEGMDPFIWASSYVFCGQSWYQEAVDSISPGSGYCVTEGSMEGANLRLKIIGFWGIILAIGLTSITTLSNLLDVDTRRKGFHGMVIVMFLIPGLLDPPFTYLCLTIVLAGFLLLDIIRAGQLPPVSVYIARFLQPYVDGRDLKGPMVVSHVFLLIGTGIGWWLTLAGYHQVDWEWNKQPEMSFSSGVACVGLGDAAASLIGRRFGRHKWGWKGGKSLEGSFAFTVAVVLGLALPRLWIVGLSGDWGPYIWAKLVFTACWGSMLEAVATGVNDNVVVPLGVWAVVRSLGL